MAAGEHQDRVAVITGGGRGFGKAFGQALAGRGAQVVLVDIDGAAADAAAREIGSAAAGIACDVADEAAMARMVATVTAQHGGIDILINNAGLHSAEYNQSLAALGVGKIRRLFDVNVIGVLIGSLAARASMSGRPNAAIINISSTAAYANATAYGVSKLAVRGLTMTLARELAPAGIRVNAIAPGLVFTETIRRELSAEAVEGVMRQQVLKREGEERDIVEAMLYLVSDRAAFITGETLRVGGGFALAV
jgi:NAD(P)-dependent dehydrogenase (short-subunit alcohol dehydrogenase family)